VELQFIGRVTRELTLMGSGSYNKSKQTNSPCLVGNIPGVAAYGQCISQVVVAGSGLAPCPSGEHTPNVIGAEHRIRVVLTSDMS